MITNLHADLSLSEIESSLLENCILNQVKIPKVTHSDVLRTAYVSFEDTYESERFTKKLKSKININNKDYNFEYSIYNNDDLFNEGKKDDDEEQKDKFIINNRKKKLLSKDELKKKFMKELNIDSRIKEDIVIHEDWICNKVKKTFNVFLIYFLILV